MADNITAALASGSEVISMDDIAGVKVQRVKVQSGVDGTATDVSSTNPLPINDAGGSLTVDGSVSISGTIAATQSGAWSQRNQDGTGTAITSSATGTNSAKQALDVSLPSKLDTTTLTITAGSGTRTFGTIDTLGYVWWTAGFTASGSVIGGLALQGSHDGTTWFSFPMETINSLGTVGSASSANVYIYGTTYTYNGPLSFRYMRAQTTGTVTGTYVLQVALTATALAKNLLSVSGTDGAPIDVNFASYYVSTASYNLGFDGLTWTRLATPTTFKTVTATASGDTAVWTPTSGKKFRLMRYMIQVTSDALAGPGSPVVIDVVLRDGTTATAASFSQYIPGTGGTTIGSILSSGWVNLGNGILSAAANNVLNVNLSSALAGGKFRIVVAGIEV